MSQILHQAEELRSKAVELLLAERQQIDNALASLNYKGEAPKKSHHKKKAPEAGAETETTP
jgi:hypothetical protein